LVKVANENIDDEDNDDKANDTVFRTKETPYELMKEMLLKIDQVVKV